MWPRAASERPPRPGARLWQREPAAILPACPPVPNRAPSAGTRGGSRECTAGSRWMSADPRSSPARVRLPPEGHVPLVQAIADPAVRRPRHDPGGPAMTTRPIRAHPPRPAIDRRARARARRAGPGQRRRWRSARSPSASRSRSPRLAGRRFGIACSSGTAGLHMAVRALGIGEGDEVITTPVQLRGFGELHPLRARQCRVFVDIEEDALGLDPALVEAAVHPRTSGILPVHVFGRPCRIDELAGDRRAPAAGSDRGRLRGARLAAGRPRGSGRFGRPRSSPSIPTSRSRPARAAWS